MRLPRLSYANVVSTVALFAAIAGGTAIAVGGGNAASVDGVSAKKLSFVKNAKPAPVSFKTFFKLGGLKLQGRCFEQSGFHLEERAVSRRKNAEIHIAVVGFNQGTPDVEYVTDVNFDRGDKLPIPETIQGNATEITLTLSTPGGSHVSAVFQRNLSGGTLGGKKRCLIGGTATYAP
ncbi:MAG: hypothetical protein ABI726_00955 [bacterium]